MILDHFWRLVKISHVCAVVINPNGMWIELIAQWTNKLNLFWLFFSFNIIYHEIWKFECNEKEFLIRIKLYICNNSHLILLCLAYVFKDVNWNLGLNSLFFFLDVLEFSQLNLQINYFLFWKKFILKLFLVFEILHLLFQNHFDAIHLYLIGRISNFDCFFDILSNIQVHGLVAVWDNYSLVTKITDEVALIWLFIVQNLDRIKFSFFKKVPNNNPSKVCSSNKCFAFVSKIKTHHLSIIPHTSIKSNILLPNFSVFNLLHSIIIHVNDFELLRS